jgi:Tfp pilus assembly protein PilX
MTQVKRGEAGIVSLMVTMVMMIVITLIVLGFAEVARNEQRSSLNAQLSTQAYYAAESGINDARAVIDDALSNGQTPQDKTTCGPDANYKASGIVDNTHGASYTCLTVDTHPDTLTYSIGAGSTVIPLISAGGKFSRFDLTWTSLGNSASCPNSGSPNTFTNLASWSCPSPVVRVDLLDANQPLDRTKWANYTATIFFVPFSSNVANVATTAARGTAVGARCTGVTTASCTASICADLTCSASLGDTYYARISTIYVETNVGLTISAAGTQFDGAQAVIDTTGKAQDVLRRVRVAVDMSNANSYAIPDGAIISSDSVCKRFGVTNTSFTVFDTVNGDLNSGGGGSLFCNPATSNPNPPSP